MPSGGFPRNAHLLESEMAQIDRQADGGKQRGGLRQVAHHLVAGADQRHVDGKQHQHQRGPARGVARSLAARLHAQAAGGEAFDVLVVGRGGGRLGRLMLDRRHQGRRVGDGRRLLVGVRRRRDEGRDARQRRLAACRRRGRLARGRCIVARVGAVLAGANLGRPARTGSRQPAPASRRSGRRHRRSRADPDQAARLRLRRALRSAGKPGRLAARATHAAPGRAERGRVDHVGGGAARADDQHGICVVLTWRP